MHVGQKNHFALCYMCVTHITERSIINVYSILLKDRVECARSPPHETSCSTHCCFLLRSLTYAQSVIYHYIRVFEYSTHPNTAHTLATVDMDAGEAAAAPAPPNGPAQAPEQNLARENCP